MYKEVLRSIDAIAIYPVISFIIFFCFFTFLLYQVWRSDKNLMMHLSVLPLDSGESENDQFTILQDKEKLQ